MALWLYCLQSSLIGMYHLSDLTGRTEILQRFWDFATLNWRGYLKLPTWIDHPSYLPTHQWQSIWYNLRKLHLTYPEHWRPSCHIIGCPTWISILLNLLSVFCTEPLAQRFCDCMLRVSIFFFFSCGTKRYLSNKYTVTRLELTWIETIEQASEDNFHNHKQLERTDQ